MFSDRSRRGVSNARTGEVTIATKVVWDKAWIAFCKVSVDGFCMVLIRRGMRGATSSFDSRVVRDVMVFKACLLTYVEHWHQVTEHSKGD